MNVHALRLVGLLGTVVDLTVRGSAAVAERVEAVVVAEIQRLTAVFSVFDDDSELMRVRRGVAEPGPELTAVDALAWDWCRRTGGAFHPGVDRLMALWTAAGAAGTLPDGAALNHAVADLMAHVDQPGGTDRAVAANLNALAKGWIIDRAAEAGRALDGVDGLVLGAGGDLRNLGPAPLRVGIEDARRRRDNAPPLQRVAVPPGLGMATSGGQRRGWRIEGRWYSHLLDPRTGRPVDHVASASVIAADTVTADVVATALTVLPLDEGQDLLGRIDGVEALVVPAAGEMAASAGWGRLVLG